MSQSFPVPESPQPDHVTPAARGPNPADSGPSPEAAADAAGPAGSGAGKLPRKRAVGRRLASPADTPAGFTADLTARTVTKRLKRRGGLPRVPPARYHSHVGQP